MNNAIIYCRLSSGNQCFINNLHTSIENQLINCRSYCSNNGFNVVKECQEIKSARNMKYLYELNKILSENNNVQLIIFNITRFSRNILQGLQYIENFKQKNITIHFVEENAKTNHHLDLHRIRLGLSQSEFESDTISNRIKSNNIVLKNKGWVFGNPKFGKKVFYQNGIRRFQSSKDELNVIELIIAATSLLPPTTF